MDQEIIFWVLWGDHYDRVWSNPIKARRVVWYIEYCILNITYDSYYSVITDKDTGKCKYYKIRTIDWQSNQCHFVHVS